MSSSDTEDTYDSVARVLGELHARFGNDTFSNRRRLNGLLADRLPDAKLETRLVLDAVDDGVIDELRATAPDQLGMQLDRLSSRMESQRGIRGDIARQAIHACAFALGLVPLPSQSQRRTAAAVSAPAPATDWVGVSEAVAAPNTGGAPRNIPPPSPPAPAAGWGGTVKKVLVYGAILVMATVTALAAIGLIIGDQRKAPEAETAQEREPQPARPAEPPRTTAQPAPAPQPAPTPAPAPVPAQPQAHPAPPPSRLAAAPQVTVPEGGFAGEARDYGIPAQSALQANVGSPTPVSVPGARVVATADLMAEMARGTRFLLIDVLGDSHQQSLPGAISLQGAGSPGTFKDNIQQYLTSELNRLTGGQNAYPLVFFCSGPSCWFSYNASLRAVAAGYSNVFWYRGGLAAWQSAGQPFAPIAAR